MKTRFRRTGSRCVSRILLLGLALQGCAHGGTANIALEDQIAKTFISIRADAHLTRLTRIKYRVDLQGWTCTAAERDSSLYPWIFKTDDPLSDPRLRRRALTEESKGGPNSARFAVAVWPARESPSSAKEAFWVGINMYWTAWWEFFDHTFTDDLFYRNDWKQGVSPACKNAR